MARLTENIFEQHQPSFIEAVIVDCPTGDSPDTDHDTACVEVPSMYSIVHGAKILEDVPIFYHCEANPGSRFGNLGRALKRGATAFRKGDHVILSTNPVAIVGFADGSLRRCVRLYLYIEVYAVSDEEVGDEYCIIWDVKDDCLAKIKDYNGNYKAFPILKDDFNNAENFMNRKWVSMEMVGSELFDNGCKYNNCKVEIDEYTGPYGQSYANYTRNYEMKCNDELPDLCKPSHILVKERIIDISNKVERGDRISVEYTEDNYITTFFGDKLTIRKRDMTENITDGEISVNTTSFCDLTHFYEHFKFKKYENFSFEMIILNLRTHEIESSSHTVIGESYSFNATYTLGPLEDPHVRSAIREFDEKITKDDAYTLANSDKSELSGWISQAALYSFHSIPGDPAYKSGISFSRSFERIGNEINITEDPDFDKKYSIFKNDKTLFYTKTRFCFV